MHVEQELLHEARATLGEPDFSKTVRRALRQAIAIANSPGASGATASQPGSPGPPGDGPGSPGAEDRPGSGEGVRTSFEEPGNTSFPWGDLKQEELRKFNEMMGLRIRAVRLKANLTQEQLASMTTIPRTDIVRMEGGFVPITFGRLIAISKATQTALGKFVDPELELPPTVEPAKIDPFYVVDPLERRVLVALRTLTVREKKVVNLIASAMRVTRDQRYDPAARRNRKQGPPTKEMTQEFQEAWAAAAEGDIRPVLEFMGKTTAPDDEDDGQEEPEPEEAA